MEKTVRLERQRTIDFSLGGGHLLRCIASRLTHLICVCNESLPAGIIKY